MNLKKIGKVPTSKTVGTGPSSYEKRIYRAAFSQMLRNTGVDNLYQLSRFTVCDSSYAAGVLFPKTPTPAVRFSYSVHL